MFNHFPPTFVSDFQYIREPGISGDPPGSLMPLLGRQSTTYRLYKQVSSTNYLRMASTASPPLTNVLRNSRSPYLLQHKDNPVAVSHKLGRSLS